MKIKNIIWDFDGTIMNTYPAIASSAHKVAELNKVKISYEDILKMTKITLKVALDFISKKSSKSYEELFQEYLSEYAKYDTSTLTLFPLVEETLELIVERDGKNYIITHRGKDSLIEHLNQHAITGFFSYLISADCNFARKPDPEAFTFLKGKFKLSPLDTIVVGDRLLDVEAGYGAGFKGIVYQNSVDFAGKLTDIADYSELIKLIKET